jgi:hypothetical protein
VIFEVKPIHIYIHTYRYKERERERERERHTHTHTTYQVVDGVWSKMLVSMKVKRTPSFKRHSKRPSRLAAQVSVFVLRY